MQFYDLLLLNFHEKYEFFSPWNCIFGSFKLFPSSKIDFWPFLKLQKMEFGQKNFLWNWFIWFHEFFWPGLFLIFCVLPRLNILFFPYTRLQYPLLWLSHAWWAWLPGVMESRKVSQLWLLPLAQLMTWWLSVVLDYFLVLHSIQELPCMNSFFMDP